MRRIESTRTQHFMLICLILLAIASCFPLAMAGKALGAMLWLVAALLALAMGITRLQILAKPALVFAILFAASFLIPVEIVLVKGKSFGIGWSRCEVVGLHSYIERQKQFDQTTYVIVQGCISRIGIKPSRVVKIRVPE